MEKCFCHIKDRITGEKYEVKDAFARSRLIDMESSIEGIWESVGMSDEEVNRQLREHEERITSLEAGGSGGSGSTSSLYMHKITLECEDYYGMGIADVYFTYYSGIATPLTKERLKTLLGSSEISATGWATSDNCTGQIDKIYYNLLSDDLVVHYFDWEHTSEMTNYYQFERGDFSITDDVQEVTNI